MTASGSWFLGAIGFIRRLLGQSKSTKQQARNVGGDVIQVSAEQGSSIVINKPTIDPAALKEILAKAPFPTVHLGSGDMKTTVTASIPSQQKSDSERVEQLLEEVRSGLHIEPLSAILFKCIEIAKRTNRKDDVEWLMKEYYGFREPGGRRLEAKEVKAGGPDDDSLGHPYRLITANLTIQWRPNQIETYPIQIFMSDPIYDIENQAAQLKAPGAQMGYFHIPIPFGGPVGDLLRKNSPDGKIPMTMSANELERLLGGLRLKVSQFILSVSDDIAHTGGQ